MFRHLLALECHFQLAVYPNSFNLDRIPYKEPDHHFETKSHFKVPKIPKVLPHSSKFASLHKGNHISSVV